MLKKINKSAFSLIELSIVILIISILLTGALGLSIQRANQEKIRLTKERMETIYKAMGIYLANNRKLPCPASMNTVVKSEVAYGTAATSCTAAPGSASGYWQSTDSTNSPNVFFGMVPTLTLGLSSDMAEDGFGSRFGYKIVSGFTNTTTFGYGSSSAATSKNYAQDSASYRINIQELVGNSSPTIKTITDDAAFAIISYGPNRAGAWSPNATTQNTVSSDSDGEGVNDVNSPDATTGKATFDQDVVLKADDIDAFDDIVFYKTRDEMTFDFDLLGLIACDEASPTNSITYDIARNFNWPASTTVKYGQPSPSTESCPSGWTQGPAKPTKKCGFGGIWESGIIDNCIQGN